MKEALLSYLIGTELTVILPQFKSLLGYSEKEILAIRDVHEEKKGAKGTTGATTRITGMRMALISERESICRKSSFVLARWSIRISERILR